ARPDRLDAAGLLRTRRALDRGESRVCRVIRVPNTTVAVYGETGARRGVSNGTSWQSPDDSAATATKRG
ncbi:MAG: hypothetical protein ACREFK_20615, partial [Stellaceae bacterium]